MKKCERINAFQNRHVLRYSDARRNVERSKYVLLVCLMWNEKKKKKERERERERTLQLHLVTFAHFSLTLYLLLS